MTMRPFLTACLGLLPSWLAVRLLPLLGHKVHRSARIGLSLLWVDRLYLDAESRIGMFNLIRVRRLLLRREAYLGRGNRLDGPLSVALAVRAAIGNGNKITRGPLGSVTCGAAGLMLGTLAKITADHRIDCTTSVSLGAFSTLAGSGSQIWTHGYVHDESGPGRYRIDGRVRIENNVYIGSLCLISMGVRIVPGVTVGGGAVVARSLTEPGLYVASALRMLPPPADPDSRAALVAVPPGLLCERVYIKQAL